MKLLTTLLSAACAGVAAAELRRLQANPQPSTASGGANAAATVYGHYRANCSAGANPGSDYYHDADWAVTVPANGAWVQVTDYSTPPQSGMSTQFWTRVDCSVAGVISFDLRCASQSSASCQVSQSNVPRDTCISIMGAFPGSTLMTGIPACSAPDLWYLYSGTIVSSSTGTATGTAYGAYDPFAALAAAAVGLSSAILAAVIGGVVGFLLLVTLVCVACFCCCKKKAPPASAPALPQVIILQGQPQAGVQMVAMAPALGVPAGGQPAR